MRSFVAVAALALAACGGGGGGGSSPPQSPPSPQLPPAKTIERYVPMFQTGHVTGIVEKLDSHEQYTQWFTDANKVSWGPTYFEALDVRDCKGVRWAFLVSFNDLNADGSPKATYPLENVKTTRNGVELDCPQSGAPYQPFDIPMDFQDTIEQWGYIVVPGDKVEFYWKATFTYGQQADNPCWLGDGPKTRSVIVQSEVWWDRNGGWVRGHANPRDATPWEASTTGLRPHAVDVTMEWTVKNALDAGLLWRADGPDVHLCLRNTGTY